MGKLTQRVCTELFVSLRYCFQCSEYVATFLCCKSREQQVDSSRWTTIRKTQRSGYCYYVPQYYGTSHFIHKSQVNLCAHHNIQIKQISFVGKELASQFF